MRIVHVSYSDTVGGASRGVYALHRSLQRAGVDSRLVVARKETSDPTVYSPPTGLARGLARFVPAIETTARQIVVGRASEAFSVNAVGLPLLRLIASLEPDIVSLQWIGGGMLRPSQVAGIRAPLVWTVRDMFPFTGGCHYDHGCGRFVARCGRCPVLGSRYARDVSRWTMHRKHRAWSRTHMTIVALSRWLADEAARSSLFRGYPIRVINPGVDVRRFRPREQREARAALGLPLDETLVSFVAVKPREPRKGWDALAQTLALLASSRPPRPLALLLVGGDEGAPEDAAVPIRRLGAVTDDERLALAYSASDALVVPSLQEAFGKVAAEALACGTPVVAFAGTGAADAVDDRRTGYLAQLGSADDLARGIRWVVEGTVTDGLRENARRSAVERFSEERQAGDYVALYRTILREPAARESRSEAAPA